MRAISKFSLAVAAPAVLFFQNACNRTPQDYFAKANKEFQAGRYEESSLDYRRAIQKNPRFAEAYHKLGMCEYAQGRVENSIDALTHASQLAPEDLPVLEDLADVTFNRYLSSNRPQGLYDSVTGMVTRILQKKTNSATGLRLQGSLQYGDGKLKEAIASYQKANLTSPNDEGVILPLADALRLDNRAAEAEALALQLIAHKPDFAAAYDWLAQLYLSTNRTADAEKLYKSRVQSHPQDAAAILSLAAFYRSQHNNKDAADLIANLTARADFANRFLLAGDFFVSGRSWPEAERAYLAGMAAEPSEKSVYLNKLALVYLAEQRKDAALKAWNDAIREQPDDWEAQGMRISLLLESKDPRQIDQAIEDAKNIVKQNPKDGRFHDLLGRAYDMKGDKRSAEGYYQQAARLDQQFAEPRLSLAEISKSRRDSQAVFRYTEEVLAVDSKNAHARLLHAWALINQNELAGAEQEMLTLADDFPDSYDVKLQMGLLYIAEKRTRPAIDVFAKLLETHPGDQHILAGLATAYFQGHSYDAAIQLVTREVQKNPSSEPTRVLLARVALRLGRPDLALPQLKVLADAHPDVADYQFELGNLYQQLDDKAAAVHHYEAAVRLTPQDANRQGTLAIAYYAAGMMDQADAAYARSLALSPNDPILLNNRAYFLAETGNNPDEAVRLAQSALAKVPENPGILDTLGLSYVQKKMGDSAYEILQRLVVNYPNEPMFRYHLAMALLLKGQKDAARKELEGSLSKHPSKDDAVKIRALLSRVG